MFPKYSFIEMTDSIAGTRFGASEKVAVIVFYADSSFASKEDSVRIVFASDSSYHRYLT